MRPIRIFLILIIITVLPAWVAAQAGESADAEADAEADAQPEGFTVAIDLRLAANVAGFVPGVSAFVGVPLSISSDSVSIVPMVGFQYLFDVWTDLHGNYYIPMGLSFLYNPYSLGLEVLYFPPVGGEGTNHMLSGSVTAEAEMLKTGNFSLLFDLSFGPVFVFVPGSPQILLRINSAFTARYSI